MMLPTLALTLAGLLPADAKSSDQEKIQGTWTVESATRGGMPAPDDMIKNTKFVFAGTKVTIQGGGGPGAEEATFTLDGGKKPGAIDIKPMSRPEQAVKGIYELQGDTLKLCVKREGDRPTEFTSTAE